MSRRRHPKEKLHQCVLCGTWQRKPALQNDIPICRDRRACNAAQAKQVAAT